MVDRAKSFAITLSETVSDTRSYLRTDEFRWRALITTGRYATHGMIVLAGVAAILLASFKVGKATPQEIVVTPSKSPATLAHQGLASISDATVQNVSLMSSPGRGGSNGNRLYTVGGPGQSNPSVARTAVAQGLSPYVGISDVDAALLTKQVVLTEVEQKVVAARAEIQTYTVQTGDTIEGIAAKFNIQPTTVIWSNDDVEKAPDRLQVGQVLKILPVNGIYYTVEQNDSLSGIAGEFKVNVDDILKSPLNNLQPDAQLQPGMQIVIPNGVKQWKQQEVIASNSSSGRQSAASYAAPAVPSYSSAGNFGWPTAASMVSQGFWWGHRGLDIAASIGVPIYASESGYVNYAGWNNTGYGNMIMLSHGGGFETLYGHLSEWYVDPGQYVSKGQLIGAMGSTGNSTGPHVHFEIRVNGVPSNPYFYLQ